MISIAEQINLFNQEPERMHKALVPGYHIDEIDIFDLKIDVMPSGFLCLDDFMFLKKSRSELIVVGGRPSHGKSAFMFQIAAQVATYATVHVFSLEMDKESILTRLVAPIINRPIQAIQRGVVNEAELTKAKEGLKSLKYIVDDRGGLSVDELCDAARIRAKRDNTSLIVVDYLQLLANSDSSLNRAVEIGRITKCLKSLAKELKIPVIIGSQLNRQAEQRGREGGKPCLSDLMESGAIEADADVVLLIQNSSRYNGLRQGEIDLVIAKNRNGKCGEIVLGFNDAQTEFYEIEGQVGI